GAVFGVADFAKAAVTQSGPPMYDMFKDTVIGPGAYVKLARFMVQGDGITTLDKVGFNIRASSTMDTLTQIAGAALYKESGTNPGFSPTEDYYVAGSYLANPATSTMAIMQTLSGSYTTPAIGQPSEYYIVASTTNTIGNIINGNAFDVALSADYASTTPASVGVFTAPMGDGQKKFILQRTIPLKISEIRAGSAGNAKDEFVEIYNPNEYYINIAGSGLALHGFSTGGGATNFTFTATPNKTYIAPFSYYLLSSATNYNGSIPTDATFNNLTTDVLVSSNGGLSLATSTNVTNATSTKVDLLCYGAHPIANCENSDTVLSERAGALAEDGSSLERIAQGYPNATSTNSSMISGGSDFMKGNGIDRDDNSAEFVSQTIANPQNTMSPKEMSFGGGFVDNSAPRVMGSYPQNGMNNVPIDMSFIGFMFDKSLQFGAIASAAATTSITLKAGGTGANLCASVTYNPMPSNFEPSVKCILSGSLSPGASYTFEVGTSTASAIRDISGNQMDQDSFQAGIQSYTSTFTTGASGQTMTNMAPPNVTGSMPFPGSFNIPTNIAKFFISFSQAMDSNTLTSSNIKLYSNASGLKTPISLSSAVFSYAATTTTLTISNLPSLSDNIRYEIEIDGNDGGGDTIGVKSSNGVLLPMPQWLIPFGAGVSDATAPSVIAALPISNGTTNVPLNNVSFIFTFNDHIDLSTATSGAVTLGINSGSLAPTSFTYDPASKEGTLLSSNLLPAGQNMTITIKGASIKNVSNVSMGSDYTLGFATEGSNSDATAPSISSVSADDFAVAVTFNEAVNSTDVVDLTKYSILANSQTMTLSAMAGHSITYNAGRKTAKIQGVRMPSGSTFSVAASNIRDISGNNMTSSTMSGTIMSFSSSGGMLEPGMGSGSFGTPPPPKEFTGAGGVAGFMPPANIMVMNSMVSASSTYGFEIPISSQIPANGQIVITFPSSSDFGVCCVATSSATMKILNDMNRDINGPGTGTIGIKTISKDSQAKTVTLTLDTATRSENSDVHDFLRFGLTDIKNPSIAKGADTSGYSLDIKTKSSDGATVLESGFSVNPVYIGGGSLGGSATTTVQGKIMSGYDGATGLDGVNVMLQSPIFGPMPRSIATSGGGNYSFSGLPVNNDYFIFTESFIDPSSTTTDYFGFGEPSPMRATSTSIINRNISLAPAVGGVSFAVKLTANASTFSASEQIDIFAGGPGQFTVKTATPGTGALTASAVATLNLPKQNGLWTIGIGPAMPKDGMMMGQPPAPAWIMPKPLQLNMTGCPTSCFISDAGLPKTEHTFTISATSKTISGVVKDASGTTIANAMLFAFSPSQGSGTQGQSDTSGKFSLNVTEGSYNVGAFFPGMGQSRELSVEITSAASNYVFVDGSKTSSTGQTGANPFVLTIKKPSYTITGKVSDGSNNIANAPVFAYRTDGTGNANAMTDSSGNYTLYVDNGAWQVGAFVPGYGRMDNQSVTVSGANQSGVNFAPSGATTYWSVAGTVFESANATIDSSEGIASAIVSARASDSGRIYETKTGSDGVYTLRVPQLATSTGQYILDVFKPGYGKIATINENLTAIPKFGIVATTTWNVRINTRNTITVNFKDGSGNFITVPEAFIDLFDTAKNSGNRTEIRNGTSTSLQIPNMSSTTVRVFIPSVPQSGISYDSDNGGTTTFYDAGKTILNVDGNEIIKVAVSSTLRTISGTVYHTSATGGNELRDVWVDVVNTSNGMHYGVSATSTNGYSIQLAEGTYKIIVAKPGYIMMPQTLTVSANASLNLVMTSATYTISGSITAGGSVAPYAFVRGEKITGGSAVTQADASGAYTLSVDSGSWRVYASSDKYSEAGYASNPVSVSGNASGINIALTSVASIQDTLMTSNTFKDTASGSFEDTIVKAKVTIDSGALGQSGSDSYITAKETVNYPNTPNVNIIANKAKDISAYSGDSQVKNLSSGKTATIELTYTTAELAVSGVDTPAEVAQLNVSTVNDQKEWETLNTSAIYYDSNGNVVAVSDVTSNLSNVAQVVFTTTEATHFSPYALTVASDPTAPETPAGLAIATPNSTTQLILSWTANTDSDLSGYYIYRSASSGGTFALLGSTASNSYTDSGLTANATYYYKVSAYDTSSFESAAGSEVSAKTLSMGGGGIMSGGSAGG
ncbi:MAG: carboxypeptidase regulatory-like domain-containing protein, partial [Patescibacteria group bacterium]